MASINCMPRLIIILIVVLLTAGCSTSKITTNPHIPITYIDAKKITDVHKIPWDQYPTIDLQQAEKKDLKVVASYPFQLWSKDPDFPEEFWIYGNYLLVKKPTTDLFCIDMEQKKVLWRDTKNKQHYIDGIIQNGICINTFVENEKCWLISLNIQDDSVNWTKELKEKSDQNTAISPRILYWEKGSLIVGLIGNRFTVDTIVSIDQANGNLIWEKSVNIHIRETPSENYLFARNLSKEYINKDIFINENQEYVFEYIEDLQFLPPYLLYLKENNQYEVLDLLTGQMVENKNLQINLAPYYWELSDTTKSEKPFQYGYRKYTIQQEKKWESLCHFLVPLKETEFLSLQYLPRSTEKFLAIFKIEETENNGVSFISCIDLSLLQEKWRIQLENPEMKEDNFLYYSFTELESLANRLYIELKNAIYEVDLISGTIPWKIMNSSGFIPLKSLHKPLPEGFNQDPDGNFHYMDRLLLLDYHQREIRWAFTLKNGGAWESFRPFPIVDPLYYERLGYLDVDDTGKFKAYYPKIKAYDRLELLESSGNYRFFYDWEKNEIQQMILE